MFGCRIWDSTSRKEMKSLCSDWSSPEQSALPASRGRHLQWLAPAKLTNFTHPFNTQPSCAVEFPTCLHNMSQPLQAVCTVTLASERKASPLDLGTFAN